MLTEISPPLLKCHQCRKNETDGRFCADCSESQRSHRLLKLSEFLRRSGFPKKIISADLRLGEKDSGFLKSENIGGLFIHGPSGVGKTFLTASLARELFVRGSDVKWRFESLPRLVMEIQDCFHKKTSSLDFLKEIVESEILVLDDLGVEKLTEFVYQAIYFVLNEREMNCRPTLITSNFSLAEIQDKFDSRISSRIAGMCRVIELRGSDRRINKRN